MEIAHIRYNQKKKRTKYVLPNKYKYSSTMESNSYKLNVTKL